MKKITDKLWISGQPSEADFDRARQAGVTRVINNRVSGEADDQPALEAARKAATSRNMDFVYIPMDFCSQAGLGYAFVNLISPSDALALWTHFEGFRQWSIPFFPFISL